MRPPLLLDPWCLIIAEPLRQRVEDIAPLAHLCVSRIDPQRYLDASALAVLEDHDWPGNVRELSNVIERSLALCTAPCLTAADLRIDHSRSLNPGMIPSAITGEFGAHSLSRSADRTMSLKELETAYIAEVLARTRGNKTEAARILGINRTTLYRRKS